MDAASVVWAPEALAEREAHHAYIAARAGLACAYAVLRRIVAAAAQLAEFPESGRRAEAGHRELNVPRLPYVIEYVLNDDIVQILHLWHTAQDRSKPSGDADDA